MKKISPWVIGCALIGLAFPPAVHAIEDGSSYDTTVPTSSDSSAYSAWEYVGTVGGASGVYIGDYDGTYWVLTAAHVGAGTFTLDGYTYTVVENSTYSDFTATIDGDTYTADLTLYQITGSAEALAYLASLSNLTLGTTRLTTNTTVLMIGYGGANGAETWGINTPEGTTAFSGEYGSAESVGIVTLASGENGSGAQGVSGDSGGGMFVMQNGKLVLAGILAGIGDVTSTSGNTTTDLGNGTFAVDLSYYSSQIMTDINVTASAIPEPAAVAMVIGMATLGLAFWRRRRA